MVLLTDRMAYAGLLSAMAEELDEDGYRQQARLLCQHDLFFLLVYGLKRRDADRDWLFERCREVQLNPNEHLDLWARGHYKSSVITFAMTIQDILNDPETTVGIFSHTRPIAKGFLRQIKREFEQNVALKAWFPDILYQNPQKESPKWSEDDGILVKRTTNPKEATVEAYGLVDGMPTSRHFKLLVYDDVVTRESVTTPDMIEKTTDCLALSYNLGSEHTIRRFIGTRYHHNDTYKAIIDRGTVKVRLHPATHDGSMTGEPVLLTQAQLDEKKRDMGIYVFSCQMLQSPTADSTQGFRREWLRHFDGDPGECNWYLLVDAANGKRKDNDYTAIWAVGLAEDGNYYAIPEVRDRINLTERAARLMALHRKYKPVEVRYERYGMMADVAYIKVIQDQQKYRFDIIEVAGPTSKPDRIKRLVPLFEQGKVYLPRSKHVTDYEGKNRDLVACFIEDEYMAFPVPVHDDMLDALARLTEDEGWREGSDKKIPLSLQWPTHYEYDGASQMEDWRVV